MGAEAAALLGPTLLEAAQAFVGGCTAGLARRPGPKGWLGGPTDNGNGAEVERQNSAQLRPLVAGVKAAVSACFLELAQARPCSASHHLSLVLREGGGL